MKSAVRFTCRYAVALPSIMLVMVMCSTAVAREPDQVINLWPAQPPGSALDVGDEADFTKPEDRLIAGHRIIKLGNVKTPQAHVYLPAADKRTGAAVVVCPGGGFSILAWDLEGTEVADWLNSHGIAAIVLKYRVPTRDQELRWKMPVQDAQRTLSIVRQRASDWELNPERIGILGFSAGGVAAARAAMSWERTYEPVDETDSVSCRPDLAVLIYPAYLANEERTALRDEFTVTKDTPPMFLVHAFDDNVAPESSVLLFLALKKANVPSELHVYDAGGHGYGLRPVAEFPVTGWADRCGDWLRRREWAN